MLGFTGFLVAGDATATARNVLARELIYRLGVLTDLVALLFVFLVVSLYRLLEGTDKKLAMLMVILVGVGVAVGLANLLTKIAPLILLSGAHYLSVFSKPQLDALSLSLLDLNAEGNTVGAVFWGLWLFPFGILVIRSGFFPRVLGILLLVAGSAYLTTSVVSIVLRLRATPFRGWRCRSFSESSRSSSGSSSKGRDRPGHRRKRPDTGPPFPARPRPTPRPGEANQHFGGCDVRMDPIDESQRKAARVAGVAFLLAMAIVVLANYGISFASASLATPSSPRGGFWRTRRCFSSTSPAISSTPRPSSSSS